MWLAIVKVVAQSDDSINTTALKTHQVVAPAVEMGVSFPATRQGKQKVFDLPVLRTESNAEHNWYQRFVFSLIIRQMTRQT